MRQSVLCRWHFLAKIWAPFLLKHLVTLVPRQDLYSGESNKEARRSFYWGIVLRQHSKGIHNNWLLRELTPVLGSFDHIAKQCYKISNKLWRNSDIINNLKGHNDLEMMSGVAIADVMSNNTKAYERATELELHMVKDIQDAKMNRLINRGQLNKIIKCLPPIIKNAIDNNILVNVNRAYCVPFNEKIEIPTKIATSDIQHFFKNTYKKTKNINVGIIYRNQEWVNKNQDWIGNVWKIKNPTLRHYRYKVILKDIFSKERMRRFGMTEDDKCEICGQVETVEHQLYNCTNAERVRDLVKQVTGLQITSLYELISCSTKWKTEIGKAILIKCLIQIDRSKHVTRDNVEKMWKFFSHVNEST